MDHNTFECDNICARDHYTIKKNMVVIYSIKGVGVVTIEKGTSSGLKNV